MPYKPAPSDPADTVQIVYVGALPGVIISAGGIRAERGVPVQVPADVAQGLLQQATWEKPKHKAAEAADRKEKS